MRRFFIGLVAAVLGATTVAALEGEAKAQEIQLTGPLAGPQGRKSVIGMRLYREGRFEIAPSFGFTLVDEYSKAFLVGGTAQYNILDWLGIGVYGAAGIFATTDLTDQTNVYAPRNMPGQTPLPNTGNVAPCGPLAGDGTGSPKPCGNAKSAAPNVTSPNFADQVGRITFMVVPQVKAVPFRGKLALFEKLFIDTDAYLHLGAAIVGVEERAECGLTGPNNTPKAGVPTTCFVAGGGVGRPKPIGEAT